MNLREHVSREGAQLSLWRPGEKHEVLYREHRSKYPAVYRRLVVMAREAKAQGWKRIGVRLLWERLRWEYGPNARDRYGFSMNDWLTRFYARDLMAENEDLRGLFETRERA